MRSGLDGGGGQTARRPRRHDGGGGEKVKGRKILKETYVDLLDVSRVAHDLRQGGCRKSSSKQGWGEVGHCLVVGQSEEWGVGGCLGPGWVERCRRVPQREGFRSIIHCDQTR
jgi:hypothetical protein